MAVPVLKPTSATNETYGGVTYHIQGELVPILAVEVSSVPIYFEHHILLYKDPSVNVAMKPMQGGFKRALAGLPVFMTQSSGAGRIAFSRDGAGHVLGFHLRPGEAIDVREHQFLAATDSVAYNFAMVKGAANMLLSSSGLFVDTFSCGHQEGILWLHGYGNIFEVTLGAGEQIDIEPGAWVYKDQTVRMETQFQKLTAGLFASSGQIVWNRFTGPGRVGIQSMSLFIPEAN